MTGSKVLLDTNIVIELFKGDQKVLQFLEQQQSVFIAAAVLAELYLGAYRSANEQKHLEQIKNFLFKCSVLSADISEVDSISLV